MVISKAAPIDRTYKMEAITLAEMSKKEVLKKTTFRQRSNFLLVFTDGPWV